MLALANFLALFCHNFFTNTSILHKAANLTTIQCFKWQNMSEEPTIPRYFPPSLTLEQQTTPGESESEGSHSGTPVDSANKYRDDPYPFMSPSAHVLSTPELLDNIFSRLTRDDNASNARVCKTWLDVSRDHIWRVVETPCQLFRLLVPIVCPSSSDGNHVINALLF